MQTFILTILARGGGGGSSGGGGGGAGIIIVPLIIIGIVISRYKRNKRIKRAEASREKAVAADDSWSDLTIRKRVEEVFYSFQRDWGELDYEKMAAYLTPRYNEHISLMLAAMKQMNRRNFMRDVRLNKQALFSVSDHADDELDRFDVDIQAFGADILINDTTKYVLHMRSESFEEIWHFEREGREWMLDSISQVNNDGLVINFEPKVDAKYVDFAQQNGFHYNADFGWLLMPLRGILFTDASYGHSDINHHVIGLYKETVIQFYEYIPIISEKANLKDHLRHFYRGRNAVATYTIAQTTLPKDYGNILVERRHVPGFFSFTPSNMTKISLEWQQFNKRFNVFATDAEKVTSLELLHPAFMEKLGTLPFQVNLEIVGNTLYLYTTDKDANYQTMLEILQDAFEEMKR